MRVSQIPSFDCLKIGMSGIVPSFNILRFIRDRSIIEDRLTRDRKFH